MADAKLLALLEPLQTDSGKHLPAYVIAKINTRERYQLMRTSTTFGKSRLGVPRVLHEPTNGVSSLSLSKNTHTTRKLMSISAAGTEDSFMFTLNTALLGGKSYPILTAALGTIVGLASMGAGLLFTATSTALNVSRTSQRVLARAGDELWQVEQIGKVESAVVHVEAYILLDPYRSRAQSRIKGWLIHEERTELDI